VKIKQGTLQEIVGGGLFCRRSSPVLRCGLEDLEIAVEMLIEFENRCHIATPVAIIGSGPNSNKGFVEHVFVAFHNKLMSSAYQVDVVGLVEL